MRIGVLGPLELAAEGAAVRLGPPKERMLLAVLVLAEGRPVAPDVLVDRIWGQDPPREVMASLHTYVSHLRRVLEPDRPPRAPSGVLLLGPAGYSLRVAPEDVDVHRFTALVTRAEQAMADGDPAGAERAAGEALALWRGEPYADLAAQEYVVAAQVRLTEARDRARELRVMAAIEQGRHAEVTGELEALTRDHPMRERLWALRAVALYRSGRQAEALEALREARQVLAEELGIDPGEELRVLERDILNQSPGLRPVTRPLSAERPAPAGRDREVAAVDALLAGAGAGRPGFALVTGEPGIGKTRLAEEVVARAQQQGFLVAVGRCAAVEGAPAFWPWTGLLRRVADSLPGLPAEDLACLPGSGESAPGDPDGARFRTYDAARRVLTAAARLRPVAVVLDDLHWADPSSLRLLRHLVETVDSGALAVICTARDRPQPAGALAEVFEAFSRARAVRLELAGLAPADLAALVPPDERSPERLAGLHERTGGNPFFVSELLRAGDDGDVPLGVRDVVLGRVARLPERTGGLLRAAAVLGREFDVTVLAGMAGLEPAEVLDLLDEAMVVEGTARPGRFRFSHALMQEALAGSLAPGRRARLHADAGRALEALPGEAAAAAHHWLLAVPAGHAGQAWRAARRAAAQASRLRAYDVAAGLLDRALEAAAGDPGLRPADHLDLLADLADARYGAGDTAGQRRALDLMRRLAAETGDHRRRILAATRYGGRVMCPWKIYGRYDPELVADLREIAGLPELDDAARAGVLGSLAVEIYYQPGGDPAERERLSARAVEHARRSGDPEALGRALNLRYVALLNRDLVDHRIEAAEEIVRLGRSVPHDELLAVGLIYQAAALLEAGRAPRALELVAEATVIAERVASPYLGVILGWLRLGVAMLHGDLDGARGLHRATLERHRVTSLWGAEENAFSGWLPLALAEAPDDAVLAGLRGYRGPLADFVRDVHALFLLAGGRAAEARELLGGWERQPPVPDDFIWPVRMAVRGEIWSELGDARACAALYGLLVPYADRFAVSGLSSPLWPFARTLCRLALVTGEPDAAAAHGRAALETARAMGAAGLVALVERDLADPRLEAR